MELWAMAFPTVALASALLQGTMLPLPQEEGGLLHTLLVPRWLAIAVVCLSLCINVWLSVWLLISFWRREPKFVFQVGWRTRMHSLTSTHARTHASMDVQYCGDVGCGAAAAAQDPLVFEMQQALQKRVRKQCEYCTIRLELGLIREGEEE
jgi:hypothetical protein